MRVVFGLVVILTAFALLACDDDDSESADVSSAADQGEEVTMADQGDDLPPPTGCPDPPTFCDMAETYFPPDTTCTYYGTSEEGCSGDWLEVYDGQTRCVEDPAGGRAYWESTQAELQNGSCTVSGDSPSKVDTAAPEEPEHCMTFVLEGTVTHASFYAESYDCLGWLTCDCE